MKKLSHLCVVIALLSSSVQAGTYPDAEPSAALAAIPWLSQTACRINNIWHTRYDANAPERAYPARIVAYAGKRATITEDTWAWRQLRMAQRRVQQCSAFYGQVAVEQRAAREGVIEPATHAADLLPTVLCAADLQGACSGQGVFYAVERYCTLIVRSTCSCATACGGKKARETWRSAPAAGEGGYPPYPPDSEVVSPNARK